jgi:hypothetical protein
LSSEEALWTLDACNGNLAAALESAEAARVVSENKRNHKTASVAVAHAVDKNNTSSNNKSKASPNNSNNNNNNKNVMGNNNNNTNSNNMNNNNTKDNNVSINTNTISNGNSYNNKSKSSDNDNNVSSVLGNNNNIDHKNFYFGSDITDGSPLQFVSPLAPSTLPASLGSEAVFPGSDLNAPHMFLWDDQRHVLESPLSSLFGPLFGGGASGSGNEIAQSSFLGSSLFGSSLFPSDEGVQRLRIWLTERGVTEAADDLIQVTLHMFCVFLFSSFCFVFKMDEVTSSDELLEWDLARMRASSLAAPLRRKVWNVILAARNKTK